MRRLLALVLFVALCAGAFQVSADTLSACSNVSSFECQSNSATGRLFEYVRIVARALGVPKFAQVTLAGASTPTPLFTPTNTVGATTPTPTPFPYTSCAVEALSANTDSVFVGSDSGVTTTNGWELKPQAVLTNLPTVNGDCGYLWAVSATSAQKVSVKQEP